MVQDNDERPAQPEYGQYCDNPDAYRFGGPLPEEHGLDDETVDDGNSDDRRLIRPMSRAKAWKVVMRSSVLLMLFGVIGLVVIVCSILGMLLPEGVGFLSDDFRGDNARGGLLVGILLVAGCVFYCWNVFRGDAVYIDAKAIRDAYGLRRLCYEPDHMESSADPDSADSLNSSDVSLIKIPRGTVPKPVVLVCQRQGVESAMRNRPRWGLSNISVGTNGVSFSAGGLDIAGATLCTICAENDGVRLYFGPACTDVDPNASWIEQDRQASDLAYRRQQADWDYGGVHSGKMRYGSGIIFM